MTIYPLFPNIVHSIEIKDFGKIQDELIDFVYNEENENPIGQIYSNRGGWQSNPFYHQSDNILFSLFRSAFIFICLSLVKILISAIE